MAAGRLQRSVGFWGLMFVSLGSIIGSGWLLGALNAAKVAGPASILSWLLAAAMLATLALCYAELGAAYPVAGGSGRFPYYSHGPIAGFTAGWASWLQAVFIPPIEAIAAIQYIDAVGWVHAHFNLMNEDQLLTVNGVAVALGLMLLFTGINIAGAKFMSESNVIVVIWKTVVPFLALSVVAATKFEPSNFTAGGGFLPFGMHGVFAALTGGVVFGLQGFEQAAQLAGEAKDPKRDMSRAILTAMAIGALLYALLQFVMIGAFDPRDIAGGWSAPLGNEIGDYGAWYTLALAIGAGWLAKALLIDAVISPTGTGVVYVGTTARLSYALGEEREMPSILTRTNKKGAPIASIIVGALVGCIGLGPFKSWNALVTVVTSSTAIMYGFAPISLAALHRLDPDRPRPYRVPAPGLVLPVAFVCANMIIYWGSFDTTWKLVAALAFGLGLFAIGATVKRTGVAGMIRFAIWIVPWLLGHLVLGAIGRYDAPYDVLQFAWQDGAPILIDHHILPEWIDLALVSAFSLAIYYYAVARALPKQFADVQIARDAHQLEVNP
jgi:amino acid transporter